MRKRLLGAIGVFLVSTGLGIAGTPDTNQSSQTTPPAPTSPVQDPPANPPPALAPESRACQACSPCSPCIPCAPCCTSGDSACCIVGERCAPSDRFWFGADYLLWWIKGSDLPPLVTTGSAAGALGQPGTSVLFGGHIENEERSGARFSTGYWLTDDHLLGIEGNFFFLGKRTVNSVASSASFPVIARPFIDATTGAETVSLVSFPGVQSGSVASSLSSRLSGTEANFRSEWTRTASYRIDLLAGFRYLELLESLQIDEASTVAPTVPAFGGASLTTSDFFGARNYFYGGQIGTEAVFTMNRASLGVLSKVALGSNHEIVSIFGGSTLINGPVGTMTSVASGKLALPTNIGRYSRDEFAVVPEVVINLGYQVTQHLKASVGYSFLYWSDVSRPGDQIDRTVNPTQIPGPLGNSVLVGPARPTFAFRGTDFWAQGINFGLEFSY
jgi:hypothetical protein